MREHFIRYRPAGPSMTPLISMEAWMHWEYRRHVDAETPGKYGWFGEVTE